LDVWFVSNVAMHALDTKWDVLNDKKKMLTVGATHGTVLIDITDLHNQQQQVREIHVPAAALRQPRRTPRESWPDVGWSLFMYNPVLTQDSMRHLLSLAMDASVKLDAPVSPTLPPDIYKYITASIIKQDETVRIMHGSVVSAKPILTLTLAPSCGCGELSAAPRIYQSQLDGSSSRAGLLGTLRARPSPLL